VKVSAKIFVKYKGSNFSPAAVLRQMLKYCSTSLKVLPEPAEALRMINEFN
jgi:hypothetical protein